MAVYCGQCGEELLGAVNRCWRCGRQFSRAVEEGNLPPVRRVPPALPAAASVADCGSDVVVASFAAAPQADDQAVASRQGDTLVLPDASGATTPASHSNSGSQAVRRVGSPFAEPAE